MAKPIIAVLFLASALLTPAAAQTVTWTGGGAASNWTDGANWSPAGAPANGSTLEFSGTLRTTSTNGVTSGSFAGLQFTNDGTTGRTGQFTLSGSAITLDGDVTTTAAVTGSLADTIGMALALSGSRTFTTNAGHNLSLSGIVSGAGFAPVKEGSGSLTLSAANTFTGALTVNSGTLVGQANAAALGAGTLALNNGSTLVLRADSSLNYGRDTTVSGTVTMIADRVTSAATSTTGTLGNLTIGNASLLVNRGPGITGAGTGQIDLGGGTFTGPVTIAAGANASLRFNSPITETVSSTLTIGSANAGTVSIMNGSFDNSWSATVVNAGSLRAFGGRCLGAPGSTTTVNGGATLDLVNANAADARNLAFNGNTQLGLITNGTGTFKIASLTQNSGTLTIHVERNSAGSPLVTLPNSFALNGGLFLEPLNVSGTATLVLTGTITDNGANLVRKISTGIVRMDGELRNKGETRLSNGYMQLGRNEALASGTGFGNVNMNAVSGATALLLLNGYNQTLNGISNATAVGRSILANDSNTDGTLTLGANDADGTFSGEIRDISLFTGTSFTGKLSLVKTGTGQLTLSALLLYTGSTRVQGGTLSILTSQTSTAGPVTVASGATLSGTGSLAGATTIAGVLAPGATAGTVGTLSFRNGLTWEGAATAGAATDWIFTLGSTAGSADLANITGSFLKGTTAGSAFNFDFGGTGTEPGTYTLATWTGSTGFTAADFSYVNLAGGNTANFSIAGNSLQLMVVPEPGTTALLLGAGAAALMLRRRRSRRT